MSHFSRFIRPGAVRLGVGANNRAEVLVSAYKNGNKKIIVAINTGIYDVNQKLNVQGASVGQWIPYKSTSLKNAEQGTTIAASGNAFECTLPPNSVTTLVEQ